MPREISVCWKRPAHDPKYDEYQAERTRWFNKISPPGNWKNSIDSWIPYREFPDCYEAAIFFTGSPLKIIESKVIGGKHVVHVQAVGYYEAVGA